MGAQFFQDASANISSTTNGFVLFSSFLLYAPCAVQIAPAGVAISPSGININPVGAGLTSAMLGHDVPNLRVHVWLGFEATARPATRPSSVMFKLFSIVGPCWR